MSAAVPLVSEFAPQPAPLRPVPSRYRSRPEAAPRRRAHVVALHTPAVSTLPLRLTRRGAVVLACLVAVFAAGLVALASASAPSSASPQLAPAVVTVHRGDTLWSIAVRIAPERDPRAVVDRLLRLNGLDDSRLAVGQTLRTR